MMKVFLYLHARKCAKNYKEKKFKSFTEGIKHFHLCIVSLDFSFKYPSRIENLYIYNEK